MLAHGLLGFAELKLAWGYLPGLEYWFGIREALENQGIRVLTTAVPPTATIEERAQELAAQIADMAGGESVNIIAHSMGGLDARYMISRLQPASVTVKSLVTISTPHHGSKFADFLLDQIDQQLCQQDLGGTLKDGMAPNFSRGVYFPGPLPTDPEQRRRLASAFLDEDVAYPIR